MAPGFVVEPDIQGVHYPVQILLSPPIRNGARHLVNLCFSVYFDNHIITSLCDLSDLLLFRPYYKEVILKTKLYGAFRSLLKNPKLYENFTAL